MTAKWSKKLHNKKERVTICSFSSKKLLLTAYLNIKTKNASQQHWSQLKLQSAGVKRTTEEFTTCSRRKQRWSRSAGVLGTWRGRASAGSPARPGTPQPQWPPWSWGRPDGARPRPRRGTRPRLRCPSGGDESCWAGAAWCLDSEGDKEVNKQKLFLKPIFRHWKVWGHGSFLGSHSKHCCNSVVILY